MPEYKKVQPLGKGKAIMSKFPRALLKMMYVAWEPKKNLGYF